MFFAEVIGTGAPLPGPGGSTGGGVVDELLLGFSPPQPASPSATMPNPASSRACARAITFLLILVINATPDDGHFLVTRQ